VAAGEILDGFQWHRPTLACSRRALRADAPDVTRSCDVRSERRNRTGAILRSRPGGHCALSTQSLPARMIGGCFWPPVALAGRHLTRPHRPAIRSQRFMSTRLLATLSLLVPALALSAAGPASSDNPAEAGKSGGKPENFQPEETRTRGSVVVQGRRVDYDAVAGTLVVHPRSWDDVPLNANPDEKTPQAQASMFFVAYFKSGDSGGARPITFLFNGGPGSASCWLHMGAFGPKRIVTADNTYTPAAPYSIVNNDFSLLDASDVVFIDAPGAGFSRIAGKDRDKAFYGVDEDAYAFTDFIVQFLTKYGRWNSPKYLLGESYGTTRAAVLINMLETERTVRFNGVVMLSQILMFAGAGDEPQHNPGVDLPYLLTLPTYAATAWYHHRLPNPPADLPRFLDEVEQFALNDYARALDAGVMLPADQRTAIANRLSQYTGLPVDYLLKADLRVNVGQFQQQLQANSDVATGRIDTRFSGPTLNPLAEEAGFDPFFAAIGSAYVTAFNDYARRELKVTTDRQFRLFADVESKWNFRHKPPHAHESLQQSTNVMPDLANAMKYNPRLQVMLNAGYFDLATPFFQGVYEMKHLQMPDKLQSNISYEFYDSGHMVYAHEPALKVFHDRVAAFIRRTVSSSAP
jgi:carboxypeptidase C (cathepsin A)